MASNDERADVWNERSALRQTLERVGQSHVLRFFDELDDAGRRRLLGQVSTIDWDELARLADEYVRHTPAVEIPSDLRPVPILPYEPGDAAQASRYVEARGRGEWLVREGKVGAFLVAGGQGTRLGYDGPKGEYPVTPIRRKPLFRVFAEQLLAAGRDAGRPIPWYVMTSDANDAATRAFFETSDFFGLNRQDVFFFSQGMMPAFTPDGRVLLGAKDSLALSPDGHGGSLRALDRSGALADMNRRGVEHLSYFQVDNPLVHCIDPLFLGLHDLSGSEMSSKTIAKAGALEKVGNFTLSDGRVTVIEYSDLPKDLAERRNPDGSRVFDAGSIAIHALRVRFVERLNAGGRLSLPWHRAEKKVPYVDELGTSIKPDSPNAVKLEQFVFDAIPLARQPIVYATRREEEFSPVKNAEGADSPQTSRDDQVARAARWLAAAGVNVPMKKGRPDCTLEIGPLYARSADEVAAKGSRPMSISPGEAIVLEGHP